MGLYDIEDHYLNLDAVALVMRQQTTPNEKLGDELMFACNT